MKLQPKDYGIIAAVLVAGAAVTFVTTKIFAGEGQEKPHVVGTASKEAPMDASGTKPVETPHETAN